MKKKILFYCQHLLGMGHYVRSLALVQGLKDQQVFFVNGGVPVKEIPVPEGVKLCQLPPIQSDENFSQLTGQGDHDFKKRRAQRLLDFYHEIQPDVIIIELFPFGRKKFEFELIPLLETNLKNPKPAQVICSLRDILVKKENQIKFEERVCKLVNQYFDKILIHSDPQVQTIDTSFSRIGDLKAKICYTGYVVPENGCGSVEAPHQRRDINSTQITVSVGGGRVGYALLKTAVETYKVLSKKQPVQMTLITGPFLPQHQRWHLDLMAADESHLQIETFVPNLCSRLRNSDVSVSMAGYNTCLDILRAQTPAVLVPFSGGGNDEQSRRAHALSNRKVVNVLHPENLNPSNLAAAIEATSKLNPQEAKWNLSGVDATRNIICENSYEI